MSNVDFEKDGEDNVVPFRPEPEPDAVPAGLFTLFDAPKEISVEEEAYCGTWPELNDIFKFYPGQFVVVTGIAGHGKSTFVLNVLCDVAREKGVRSFLYVPENERNLVAKLQGIWNRSQASFEWFAKFQCVYQSAKHEYDAAPHTLEWVLDRAYHAINRWDCGIVLIDPWNELEFSKPPQMLMTDYIGRCLMTIKQFCRQMNVVVVLVAHPTKAVNENGGRTPGLADIEGSMNWYNKCDNGLIVVRDKEVGSNRAKVISAKVREYGAGKIGACHFHVDPRTGVFTPMIGSSHGDMEIT